MGERKQRMAGQRDRRRGEDLGTHNCRTETDARTLASWGVDYWKLDGCNVPISDMEVRYCCSLFTSGGREEGKRGETKGEIKESGERERAMTDTDYTGNPRDIERRQRSLFPASNHLSLSSASSSPSLLLILILILSLSLSISLSLSLSRIGLLTLLQARYTLWSQSLNSTGRPIVFSCSWPAYQPSANMTYVAYVRRQKKEKRESEVRAERAKKRRKQKNR